MDWQDVLSSFATQILVYLMPVLASLVAAWLIAKVKLAWQETKTNKPELVFFLEQFARMAVRAAEQSGAAGLIVDKRKYAFEIVEKMLLEKGWKIDLDVIYAAIEAAVLEEFNKETETIIVE